MRPGWQTSEFWLSLVSAVLMLLVGAGVISPNDAPQLRDAADHIVVAIASLLGAVCVVVKYVHGRTELKHHSLGLMDDGDDCPDDPPPGASGALAA